MELFTLQMLHSRQRIPLKQWLSRYQELTLSLIHIFNRKAWDYVQDELKASGTRPGPGQQIYGCDVPDDMCYQCHIPGVAGKGCGKQRSR